MKVECILTSKHTLNVHTLIQIGNLFGRPRCTMNCPFNRAGRGEAIREVRIRPSSNYHGRGETLGCLTSVSPWPRQTPRQVKTRDGKVFQTRRKTPPRRAPASRTHKGGSVRFPGLNSLPCCPWAVTVASLSSKNTLFDSKSVRS